MKELMRLEGLNIAYGDSETVKEVSFAINDNEIVSIVGESGSGKTTLIRGIMGILPANGHVTSGRVWYGDKDLMCLDKSAMSKIQGSEIGMIFQNPSSYMNPILKISNQFVESIRAHRRLSVSEAKDLACACLKKVELDHPEKIMEGYLHELSGGMQQRVYIAMVMANTPRLILADEPTSALDVVVGRAIADELLSLKKDFKTSMLVVTHDIALASYISDRIVVMKDGLVLEMGDVDQIIHAPQHEYTKELIDTVRCLERD